MNTSLFRSLFVCLLVLLAGAPSHARASQGATAPDGDSADVDLIEADRPGIADSSAVVGAGRLQVETGYQADRDEGGSSRTSSIPTLVRIGLGERWEARVESNVVMWTSTPGQAADSGWAPTSLGAKYRFVEDHAFRQTSMALIARVTPASSSDGFGTSRVTSDARLVADIQLTDRLALNPNAGIARYEGSNGSPFTTALLAVTVGYAPSERVNPFVDVAWQSSTDVGGPSSLVLDAGLGWIVVPDVQLDFSAGWAARGPGPSPFVSAGLSFRMGGRARAPLPALQPGR